MACALGLSESERIFWQQMIEPLCQPALQYEGIQLVSGIQQTAGAVSIQIAGLPFAQILVILIVANNSVYVHAGTSKRRTPRALVEAHGS